MNIKKNPRKKSKKEFNGSRLLHLTIKNAKTMFRDKSHLIWLIGYPFLIIFIFSLAFGSTYSQASYNISILNDDTNDSGLPVNSAFYSETLIGVLSNNSSDYINVKNIINNYTEDDRMDAEEELKYERISAVIVIPSNFTETIFFNQTPYVQIKTIPDPVVEGVIGSIVKQIVDYCIIHWNNATPSEISTEVYSNTVKITTFDRLAPGYVIMAITVCISQMAIHFAEEKEKGTLKRLITTPVSRRDILLSGMFSELIVAAVLTILTLLLLWLFGGYFHPGINFLLLIAIPMLFAFTSLGFGLILASLVKDTHSAGTLVWFIILPLQFLGGLFFSFDSPIGSFIPTSYAGHAMRLVMVSGLTSWDAIGIDILAILGFGIVSTLIGILLFQRKKSIL